MKYTLGTVCKLKNVDTELIIIGYNSKSISNDHVYEYVGCLLKEGFTNSEKLYKFNNEHIETILYEGYSKKETKMDISNSIDRELNNDNEEYIFDENGVLIDIRRPSHKQNKEEITQNNSAQIILETIDINNL